MTYKCDRCSAERSDNNQFWTVGVVARPCAGLIPNPQTTSYTEYAAVGSMHVCRECLDHLGVVVHRKPVTPESQTYPTLEEVIREIASEAAREAVQS